MTEKVILGLSGGVDSAVAAQLLKNSGYRVHGLYLDIGLPGGIDAAREAAESVEIPLTVRDIRPELEEKVCAPFVSAYLRGETPNPCIMCNPAVKFSALLSLAEEAGAGHIATGHYARVRDGALYRGTPANDQSYMLCRLTRQQVKHLLLPLGGYEKAKVRALAAEMGLAAANKPDSMEICFIPDGDYATFIESRGDFPPPGNFVDETGRVLGRHKGIHHYTLGQRRGLGIAAGTRIFVSEIRPETNEVVLSGGEGLFVTELTASQVNWLTEEAPSAPFDCTVKVRHSKTETPATAFPSENGVRIVFRSPVRAPTSGQSAVMYGGDRLLGGGYIV